MKRLKLLAAVLTLGVLTAACGGAGDSLPEQTGHMVEVVEPDTTETDTLVIGEKLFLTQINEIFNNFDSYRDTTVEVEGMYTLFYDKDGVQNTPAVYRKGPGCCGNDGWGGFLLQYDGEYPEDNAWIRVTGTPELVIDGYDRMLYLHATDIEVLKERGAEFVTQ